MCWGSQQPHLAPDHRDDVAARDRVCGWHVAVPLLIAEVGGGMIISPNLTLALQNVSVAMAGAAGGAVQAARRIGAAIGSAVPIASSIPTSAKALPINWQSRPL